MKRHQLHIMDQTGHTTIDFDPANDEQVKNAMKKFAALVIEKKFTAAKRTGGGDYTLTKAFDPNAEEHLFIPQLKGG